MLNKELLMGTTGGQQPVALTVGKERQGTSVPRIYEYGYKNMSFGALSPEPFWGNYIYLQSLKYRGESYTSCRMKDSSITVTVYVSGYPDSSIRSGESIYGDIFELRGKVNQDVYLTFDPPPTGIWIQRHTNRSKKRVLCRRSSLGGARC